MNDHFESPDPPYALYHYTSQAGLIGILSTMRIWASSIHYLNDSREFALAIQLARKELTKRTNNASSQVDRDRLQLLHESLDMLDTHAQPETCVCCFSEVDDSLSQWRSYGGGKAGFSVGFSREWFAEVKETLGISLHRCIYNEEAQEALIQKTIDEFFAASKGAGPEYWDPPSSHLYKVRPRGDIDAVGEPFPLFRNAGHDFANRLARIAPLIKDKSFEEEKEWRLVAQNVSPQDLEYRPGESMIIPYYTIPIGDESKFDSIGQITVGPTPHPQLSLTSAMSLIATAMTLNGSGSGVAFKVTDIPFRSW